MKFRAIAIDDERSALEDLALVLKFVKNIILVAVFTRLEEALAYLENGDVDVIFCDLDLSGREDINDLEGLGAAGVLKDYCDLFFFFTGHPAFRLAAIDTIAVGYLLKPVQPEKVKEGLEWLKGLRLKHAKESLKLKIRDTISGEVRFVDIPSILYFTTEKVKKNHVNICTTSANILVYRSLNGLMEILMPTNLFIQAGKNSIVAKDHIRSIRDKMVLLPDGRWFPIGRAYAADFDHFIDTFE